MLRADFLPSHHKPKMKKYFLYFLLVFIPAVAFSGDVYEDVSDAIRSGKALQVSNFFSANVDLTILAQENIYTKAQAEVVLKDFFSKNAPKNFTILHQGTSKEGSMYAIGNYETAAGTTYRTYFFIKVVSGKNFIQELRFEKE